MKNKNRAEQYFRQKNFSVLEIILLVVAIASGIVATFVRNGGPIGLPVLLVSIIAFCVCRSVRIKDAEIEQTLQKIIQDNQIAVSDHTLAGYELKDSAVQKTKEGKLISPNYYVTNIVTASGGETEFHVYRIDLIRSSVEKRSYCVKKTDEVVLTEETVKTNSGLVRMTYLKIGQNDRIPVLLNDYQSSQLAEQICKKHEKN